MTWLHGVLSLLMVRIQRDNDIIDKHVKHMNIFLSQKGHTHVSTFLSDTDIVFLSENDITRLVLLLLLFS